MGIELEQPAVAGDEQRAVPLGKGHDEVVRPIVVGRQRMPQRWVDLRCADTPDLGEEDGQIFLAVERSELLAGFAGQSNAEGQTFVVVEFGHPGRAPCSVQSVECRANVRQRIGGACRCSRRNASKRAQATT
ncbi:MAG TPA: hypothetical protein VFZ70_04760 [Euzebyales bacterium]